MQPEMLEAIRDYLADVEPEMACQVDDCAVPSCKTYRAALQLIAEVDRLHGRLEALAKAKNAHLAAVRLERDGLKQDNALLVERLNTNRRRRLWQWI